MLRREAQLLVNYRNSPLAGDGDGGVERGPRPGDRAPDCRGLQRAAVNHPLRLFELLADPDHTLLLYQTTPDSYQPSPKSRTLSPPQAVAGRRPMSPPPPPNLPVPSAPMIVDAEGEFQTTYAATGGSGYLVRPVADTSASEPPRSGRRPCETTSSGCSPPKPPHACRGSRGERL